MPRRHSPDSSPPIEHRECITEYHKYRTSYNKLNKQKIRLFSSQIP